MTNFWLSVLVAPVILIAIVAVGVTGAYAAAYAWRRWS